MQRYLEAEDKKMRDREAEFNLRLKKIQEKMDAMADTVVRNENEKRLREEKRLLQLQHEKDMREMRQERENRQRKYEMNLNINKYLVNQMDERKQKHKEILEHDHDMQVQLLQKNRQQQEEDNRKMEEYKKNLLRNKDFQLKQAEDKKNALNLEMNTNEEKMNKELLQSLRQRNMI